MASQTSQSSSTSNTNTTITQPMILLSSSTNLVSVKLDPSNYMLWKFQICSTLSAYALFDIVDGTYPCPEKYNKDSNGNLSLQVNPEYLQWCAKDQALISMISATLSQSALSLVIGQKSAKGVWDSLERRYTSLSRSNVLGLKRDLNNIKKNTDSISVYMLKIKECKDKLEVVGVIMEDEELLHIVLDGLPQNFYHFYSAMRTRSDTVSFEQLLVLLTAEEKSLKLNAEATPEPSLLAMLEWISLTKVGILHPSLQPWHPPLIIFLPITGFLIQELQIHFTPDLANIQHPTEYTGTDTVTVVYKCCKDNNCSFHFDASKFSIQDIPSGKVLYKGLSEAASVGVRASNPSTSTWHSRLGPGPTHESTTSSQGRVLPTPACPTSEPTFTTLTQLPIPEPIVDTHVPTPSAVTSSPSVPEPIPNALPSLSTTTNTHPMQTRLKSGITKKKAFHTHKPDYLDTEPPSFTVASSLSPWVTAMEDEFSALHRQQTWTLVPPHPSQNVVGCKWVYKIKRNSDGTVSRYKARLVAKGFHQQAGIDYDETFSPVVKPTTVRIILTLAAQFQWPLRQLDISNAFLHGFLKEDVHMTQPQGFLDPTKPGYVCKLHKSLYGLKQAPRAWFDRFTTHLLSLGFTASTADPSLFVFHSKGAMLYLLLYVDDIILTGTSPTLITDLISTLQSTFELKDLGPLHYFLGLQLQYHTSGFTVHQTKYATDLLSRFNMTSCKPSSTPFASSSRLTPTQGHPLSDPTSFRSLVGALQYLTFTRPDLSFAVNQVCQFMHKPTDAHLMAAKRILRYLRGTLHRGLLFRPSSLHLQAYADADWAGDPVDRRSTSGNIVFLGSTPITWVSKKQNTVSRSSTEAEYRSLASATAELFWIRMVLKDLGIFLPNPPILWCDNLSALALASNPVFHARTKHIEVDYHFVREKVLRRDVV
uniref:Reverse transcriptase Ty1/copia-type domain-containing protein n=1 Tax=Fagus sylvatica TaxID=28930 RepID=A0A2N9FGX9_FAGSY